MDNFNQPVSKNVAIKKIVWVVIITIVFGFIISFAAYGRVPVKSFLIASAFVISVMIIGFLWGLRNQVKMTQDKTTRKKFFYLYSIVGILTIIIEVWLLFIGERGPEHYMYIIIGLSLVYFGFKKIKQDKN